MSIQYRCRCGQEVTLRTREPLYLVMSLLLGLTILNSTIMAVLWYRITDRPPAPRDQAAKAQPAPPPEVAREGAPGELVRTDGRMNSPGSFPPTEEVRISMPSIPFTVAVPEQPSTAEAEAVRIPVMTFRPTPTPATTIETAAFTPATIEFTPPAGISGLRLLTLLSLPLENELERAAVLVAASAWGSGPARTRAREQLASDARMRGLLPLFDQALPSGAAPGVSLRLSTLAETSAETAEMLTQLSKQWPNLWERLEVRAASPGGTAQSLQAWVAAAGNLGREQVDFLVLLDVSESMAEDLPRFRDALAAIAPLAACADGSIRWGFVGYRDDVVSRAPLDASADRLLESAAKWSAEGGGDVPEGVDQAIFEALRLDSFEWRPAAQHRVLIVGDAPPPYERISSMLSFVEGAHESPERYIFSCVGILREAEFAEVPSFRPIAERGGGVVTFLSPKASLFAPTWAWVFGKPPPDGLDPPF